MDTLIMVPGHLCDERLFRHQARELGRIFHVMVPVLDKQTSLRAMAQTVLQQTEGPFHLLGLSMGGYVGLEVLRQASSRVLSFVSMNSMADGESADRLEARQRLVEACHSHGFNRVHQLLLPAFLSEPHLEDPALRDIVRQMAARVGEEGFHNQFKAITTRPDYNSILADIICPTLVIGSSDDQLIPADRQKALAAGITGADLIILGRCGHLSTLERPDATSTWLEAWYRTLS